MKVNQNSVARLLILIGLVGFSGTANATAVRTQPSNNSSMTSTLRTVHRATGDTGITTTPTDLLGGNATTTTQ